jgi:hypothetical protein
MDKKIEIRTFLDFLNEIHEKKDTFLDDLSQFLEREGIYGFEHEINNILMGNPSKDTLTDLEKSFYKDDGIDVSKSEVLEMNRKNMLERFLNLKGITGYTEAILNLWGQHRKEGKDKVIKINDKPIYHLKPSEDTIRIWTWDNQELNGVPKLISVDDLYGVERFGLTNPASYRYIKV